MSGKDYRSDNKRVLLLGTGLVSEPVVEYLTRSPDVKVTVGQFQVGQFIVIPVFVFMSAKLSVSKEEL